MFVNILGLNDPALRRFPAGEDLSAPKAVQLYDFPLIADDGYENAILLTRKSYIPRNHPVQPADTEDGSVGTLEDGSPWNGTVRFRWDAEDLVYRSDGFRVTLNATQEIVSLKTGGNDDAEVRNIDTLRIYVYPIQTTQAQNGNCFLCAPNFTNDQVFQSGDVDGE